LCVDTPDLIRGPLLDSPAGRLVQDRSARRFREA
jgi:hypothetical protein